MVKKFIPESCVTRKDNSKNISLIKLFLILRKLYLKKMIIKKKTEHETLSMKKGLEQNIILLSFIFFLRLQKNFVK